MGEQKGDQSQLRTQKGASLKPLEGFRGGTTQIRLENDGMLSGEGSRKSSRVIRRDHFREVTFKGGIG